ncbi:FMN reductase [Microbacterium awajiense]|uniref:FMN reductase n=1 Tax=Microbacterium awajiense TaxID=415214 RepID=A0ABP7AZ31_9MICO
MTQAILSVRPPEPVSSTARLNVVAVSGSVSAPSKTRALLDEIVAALGNRLEITAHTVSLNEIGPALAGAVRRDELPPTVEAELERIERADVLVVASPVYRAAVSGLFKHLFDLVDQHALAGTPVIVSATGGSDRHALVVEHHLRPLFAFFQAVTLPLGVYACEAEFSGGRVAGAALRDRIERAVEVSVPLIRRLSGSAVDRSARAVR